MAKIIAHNIQSCASWIVINPVRLRAIVFVLLVVLALLVIIAPTTMAWAGNAPGGSH
jgi:hypothetical protein